MKRLLLLLSIVLVSVHTFAQENPERGFVITNENDTLFGFIDLRTDKINCSQCSFKVDGTEEYKLFKPGDIKGYRFMDNGKFYVSRTFEYEDKSHNVFAEYMVKGMLNVYRVSGLCPDYVYFFENEGDSIISYRSREDIADQKSNDAVSEARKLFTYLMKSEASTKEIKIGYMPVSSVLKIAHQYHEDVCTSNEDCIEFEYDKKSDKVKVDYNVHAGWTHFFGFQGLNAKVYDMPSVGFGVELEMDRVRKNLRLQFSIDYAYGTGHYERREVNKIYRAEMTSHMLFLKFGPQFGIGKEKGVKFTVRCGLSAFLGLTKEPNYFDRYVPLTDKWTSQLLDDVSIVDACFCAIYGGIGLECPVGHGSIIANVDAYTPHIAFVKGAPSFGATIGYRF